MRQRKKEKFFNKILFNQITVSVVGLMVIAIISIPLAKNVSKQYNINKEVNELEAEIGTLETKNKELDSLLGYLASDEFVEEQARLNLGLRKEGEEMIIVKDRDGVNIAEDEKKLAYNIRGLNIKNKKKVIGNFSNWWNFFLK